MAAIQCHYTLSLLLCLFLASPLTAAYKILIFSPRVGHSHINYFGRIADILVEAGYDVVVYIVNLDPEVKSNGTRLARVIENPQSPASLETKDLTTRTWLNNGDDLLEVYKIFLSLTTAQMESCSNVLQNEEILDRLRAEKFDLGITEVFSFCGYGIFEKIGLKKYVTAFTVNLFEVISDILGVSSNPSYVPGAVTENADVMSYWERFNNVISYASVYSIMRFILLPEISRFSPYWPVYDIEEAIGKSSFAFVNSEELLEFPRLLSEKIVYVGGIAVERPKPLNEEYQHLMDNAGNGAVLISFGSVAKSMLMTAAQKKAFCDAFAVFPEVTFIWKYERNDSVAADFPNVFKRRWVPQTDLLGHPNLRAFISHCGQNSLMESVYAGVPLICVPLFGDQMRNAKIAEKRHVGIIIHKSYISTRSVTSALNEILHGTRYRESARMLARMIREKPFSAKERLLRYTEFAIKFGPIDSFDMASNRLSLLQYYLLDIIVPIFLALCMLFYAAFRLIRSFLGYATVKINQISLQTYPKKVQ